MLGIKSYYGYTLAQFNPGRDEDFQLHCASFTSDSKPLTLPCQVRFLAIFYLRKLDSHLLKKFFMCFNERPLKVMKNAFLFHLQFRSQ